MARRKAWWALGAGLGLVGAAVACELGVDPAAKLIVVAGDHRVVQAPSCSGPVPSVAHIEVDEDTPITVTTVPVDENCNQLADWEELVKKSGSLKISELFDGDPEDPYGLISFAANGTPVGSPAFYWGITPTPPGGVFPATSGTTPESLRSTIDRMGASFLDTEDSRGDPGVAGTYRIVPVPDEPGGKLKVRTDLISTVYHVNKLSGSLPPELAEYDAALLGSEPVGYTSFNGFQDTVQGTASTGGELEVVFETPTFNEAVADFTGETHYSIIGSVRLGWEFDNVRIPIGVCEWTDPPPTTDTNGDGVVDSNDAPGGPPDCDPADITVYTMEIRGTIIHEKSLMGGGNEGHPGAAIIAVKDTTPPVVADSGTATGQAYAGRPPEMAPFEVRAWDNNPRGEVADYALDAWYLVERSVWARDGTVGAEGILGLEGDPGIYHLAYADDTFAASPGHAFRWVRVADAIEPNAVDVVTAPDGSPLGVEITWDERSGMLVSEPTGTHFAAGVSGGGDHAQYTPDGLKFVYRVEDLISQEGHPPDDPALETTIPGIEVAQSWAGEFPANYQTGGPAQTGVPDLDDFADPELIKKCSQCGTRSMLAGLPTWSVEDDLPPSLVLIAHDKKYDKVYYFGHTFLADATCGGGTDCTSEGLNKRYLAAFQDGITSDPELENLYIQPWVPSSKDFERGDDPADYDTQRAEYTNTFFPAAQNYYGDESYPALWIDEDTRVEFFVTAWDNVEGWIVNGGPDEGKMGGGLDLSDITIELKDGPTTGDEVVMTEPDTYLFRNPNRPDDLGDATVRVTATDKNLNTTEFTVHVHILDNSLRIHSLEESRSRLSND